MAGDGVLNRNIGASTQPSATSAPNAYKTPDEARAAATEAQNGGGYVIVPYQHRLRYLNSDQRTSRTVPEFETRYALAPAPPTSDSRWDGEEQTWRGPRHYGWSDKVGDVMQVVIPAMLGAGVGGMAAGAAGGGTTGAIAGGAASGATQAVVTGNTDNIGKAALTGAVSGGVGSAAGGLMSNNVGASSAVNAATQGGLTNAASQLIRTGRVKPEDVLIAAGSSGFDRGISDEYGRVAGRVASSAFSGAARGGLDGAKAGAVQGLLTGYGQQYGGNTGRAVGGLLAGRINQQNRPQVNQRPQQIMRPQVVQQQAGQGYNLQQMQQLYAQYLAQKRK